MRFARLAVVLAVGASGAWVQRAAAQPSSEPSPSPTPAPASPASDRIDEPAAPTGATTPDGSAAPPEGDASATSAAPPPAAPRRSSPEAHGEQLAPEPPSELSGCDPCDELTTVEFGPSVAEPADGPPGFRFGSYGRVIAGSDLRGGKPEKILIVAHGPRIVEDSYLELEFSYGFKHPLDSNDLVVRPIITLAFDGTLFHDTGEFDAQPALRNMFLDGHIGNHLKLWVGSRMYRGDDIYLFDYWPLDDINTVGGGIEYSANVFTRRPDAPDRLELAAHIGFNRLNNPFQYQTVEVPNPVQGATTVDQLNRQRTVASATAAYVAMPRDGGVGAKLKLHGEYHALPAGTSKRDDGTFESLPADHGFLIGAEVGTFGFSKDTRFRRHLNAFLRYAKGLAAFDELAPPTSFGPELTTQRANELTFGVSGNWDHEYGNLMIGALSRRFIDADANATDPDDGWEYAVDARPLVRVVPDWFVGADVSYQARFPDGLNAITLRAEDPAVFQIAPMIAWSPMGPSAYDRPQIRLVYRAAHLNEAALDEYVPDDPRHAHEWVHFLGLQAEWWFNSSTYR
jgi:maltoporin